MPYYLLDPSTAAAAPASTAGAPKTSVGETLLSLRTDLLVELGARQDANDPVKLNKWINKAYLYLCSILDITDLHAQVQMDLVPNQPLYKIPDSVAYIRDFSLTNDFDYIEGGITLRPIDLNTFRKLPDDDQSLPGSYLREGQMIVVYPTPLDLLTGILDFKVRPAPLINDTDSPILPPEFHESLLLRAKHVAFRALKSHIEAGIARNDFAADVRVIEDTDGKEQGERPTGVRPILCAEDYRRLR